MLTKDTHIVQVPFKKDPEAGDDESNWEYRDVPMYWPPEVLQYLWETVGVEVSRDKLLQYWEEARERSLPWADGSAGDNPKIPLKLFGDDASYGKQNDKFMALVISSPLWRPHANRNSRWTVAVLNLHGSLGYPTLQPILRALVWSLNQAYDVPLESSGHTFQVTELGGDWKYVRESFNMTTHWNSSGPGKCCHFCTIDRKDMARLHLLEPLPYRSTNEFIRDVISPRWPSPLILLRHFHIEVVQRCLLHTCHLGLLWTANGGAMDYLLQMGMWGSPRLHLKTRLLRAYLQFKLWRQRFRIRCSQRQFTVKMLYKKAHGAYLSCKGWNSRVVSAWLGDVCDNAWSSMRFPDDELTLLAHAMPLGCEQASSACVTA